ncbi:MAG: glycosyltransferase family 39 protein, partial [Anaerolineae bacterium]|nr:glycosyltransferase family 39 protein [Anaerolineae bacterium]
MTHQKPLPQTSNPSIINYQLSIINYLPLLVLLLAAGLRLYHLPSLPPGLNFDEAGNGVAALDILDGHPQVWWRIGGGKEPLWPYLVALSTAVLGPSPLALRLPAALFGILTVAAVYPLTLALFRRRYLALLAMLGLALSDWHLHF